MRRGESKTRHDLSTIKRGSTVEVKTGLRADAEEAKIALELLKMIHRDLASKPA
jgi:hypothetical protein